MNNSISNMPKRNVFSRHGESEGNIIQRAVKKGKIPDFPESSVEHQNKIMQQRKAQGNLLHLSYRYT
jgi:hypothetical protein